MTTQPSTRPAPPALLSVLDSCRYIGIGRTKFYELLAENQIAAVKLGSRTLIARAELDRFVAQLAGDA